MDGDVRCDRKRRSPRRGGSRLLSRHTGERPWSAAQLLKQVFWAIGAFVMNDRCCSASRNARRPCLRQRRGEPGSNPAGPRSNPSRGPGGTVDAHAGHRRPGVPNSCSPRGACHVRRPRCSACCSPRPRSRCSTCRPEGWRLSGPSRLGYRRRRSPTLGVEDLTALVLPAVGVAVVAYSDNDLTGRIFASRNGYSSMPTRSSPRWEPPTSRRGWCRASR